ASVAERWAAVQTRVAAACAAAGRDPAEVQVLGAVKAQPPAKVLEALAAGLNVLGHNRVQEAAATLPEIREAWDGPLEVHMIGTLQSNKVNAALRHVDCVQSLDRLDLAQRLSRAAEQQERTLDVFVQVNSSGEETKGGVDVMEAIPFAAQVAALPALRLRGLMTIGAHSPDPGIVRRSLAQMAQLSEALVASRAPGTTEARELSMGMSGDLEEAIAAGATMVRIGTAIFGERP
ncbi:MAG TPA: YggS family pyridoxal phosphate-dependent enzyme, partial [Actinomycetales bacterium]|nr:YggS family pyridoxal phosphate-dependent enzyme [Actinomycetales bacterium]